MSDVPSFLCRDCGAGVYSFTPFPVGGDDRCAVCKFVASIPDEIEREGIRKVLNPHTGTPIREQFLTDSERLLLCNLVTRAWADIRRDREMAASTEECVQILQKISPPGTVVVALALERPNSPVNKYVDSAFPERRCDYCESPYQGPAVYCSLNCAVSDA